MKKSLLQIGIVCLWGISPVWASSDLIVDLYHDAPRELQRYQEHLEQKQWESALTILSNLQENHGDQFLQVKPARYVNLHDYCQSIINQGPAELRQLYRNQNDAQATANWQNALQQNDEQRLVRLLQTNHGSEFKEPALKRLAELAWNRKEFSAALDYWQQIPAMDSLTPKEQAKLITCLLMSGRLKQARNQLDRFKDKSGKVVGTLLNQTGNFADILEKLLAQQEASLSSAATTRLQLKWKKQLPFSSENQVTPALGSRHLLLTHQTQVYGFQLETGHPPFRGMEEQNPIIYPLGLNSNTNILAPNYAVVSSGKLFAILQTGEESGSLICLDLDQSEGKLLWKVPDSLAGGSLHFRGAPLIKGNQIYWTAAGQQRNNQLVVCGMDATTGRLQWVRPVCSSIDSAIFNSPGSPPVLSQSGASIMLSIPGKMSARLSPITGTVREIIDTATLLKDSSANLEGVPCVTTEGTQLMVQNKSLRTLPGATRTPSWNVTMSEPGQLISHIPGTSHQKLLWLTQQQIYHLNLLDGQTVKITSLPAELKEAVRSGQSGAFYSQGEVLLYLSNGELSLYRWE